MYMYNWFTLLYILNLHNIVNQLYLAKIFKRKKSMQGTEANSFKRSEDFLESSDSGMHVYSVD